ncbi:MAG: hypothetical protein IIB38_00165 [Candidatus Hydrogenedentes bacterium]|nr:hypothetical protein [Candidatus Hydrogenedentota bacterium]
MDFALASSAYVAEDEPVVRAGASGLGKYARGQDKRPGGCCGGRQETAARESQSGFCIR